MLELLAAAIVQLPTTDIRTAQAVLREIGTTVREPIAGVRVRAFADEKGKVQRCELISFAGSRQSADRICGVFKGEKVKPASDIDGTPIGGFMETTIWLTPNPDTVVPALPDLPPDAQLTVQRLPGGVTNPFRLTLGLIIDEIGAVAACGPINTEHQAMAAAACQSIKDVKFPVVQERNEEVARYARPYDVEFTAGTETVPGA